MSSYIDASVTSGLVSSADLSGVLELKSGGVTKATVNSSGVTITSPTISSGSLTFSNGSTQSVGAVGSSTQTWQNVSASRALSTTYTNSTGLPIQVLFCGGSNATYISYVNGVQISNVVQANQTGTHAFIVPNGQTYQITGGTLNLWAELR